MLTPGYNSHSSRGELRGLCPEELTHGVVFAVADAVRSEAGSTGLLNAWKRCLLSTPFTFVVLATANQHTWHALQLRELLSTEYFAARRSCMQRRFEVAKLRHRLAETVSTKATAYMIDIEYQKQLALCPDSAWGRNSSPGLEFPRQRLAGLISTLCSCMRTRFKGA